MFLNIFVILISFIIMSEQQLLNDERLQKLLNKGRIQKPTLLCDNGHEISHVCLSPECKYSSFFCSICNLKIHLKCHKEIFDTMYMMLMDNFQNQKSIFKEIYQMGIKLIDFIQKSQQSLAQRLSYQFYDQKIQKMIKDIFIDRKFQIYNGQDMKFLKQRLLEKIQNLQLKQNKITENIESIYFKLKQIIEVYFEKIVFMGNSQKINSFNPIKLNSYISNKQEDINFIIQSLESIKQVKSLQLLYRASQNQFSAAKFHSKCDHHEHTFILIRTEFEKTIGGYTPLKWNQIGTKLHDLADYSQKSFLLQMDLKQKMNLINAHKAIACSKDYGPIFGDGRDILINDKCDKYNNSYAYFPQSYNFSLQPYKNNQQIHTAFIGATDGYNFKVKEYEVFKVQFK